jgi:hypothetical protein
MQRGKEMNINTLKAIEFVFTNCPIKDKINLKIDSSEAEGEWFHKLICETAILNKYILKHLEFTARAIGNLHGEGLWINYLDEGRILILD